MPDYSLYSDIDLVDLLKSGDRSAFAEIYHRYKLILHRNKTRNHAEAEDALQEVFTVLWSKCEIINIGNNLPGYLYSALRNNILNMIARQQVRARHVESIQRFTESGTVTTDHRVRENMLKAVIEREIQLYRQE